MIIEIEINDEDLLQTPEQVIILSNFKYEKDKMQVAVQTPGFLAKPGTKVNPLVLYFGTSHSDITKKRTEDKKAEKKRIMDKNNELAQIAKNNKDAFKQLKEKEVN